MAPSLNSVYGLIRTLQKRVEKFESKPRTILCLDELIKSDMNSEGKILVDEPVPCQGITQFESKTVKASGEKVTASSATTTNDMGVVASKNADLAASVATSVRGKEAEDLFLAEAKLADTVDTLASAIGIIECESVKNPAAFAQIDTSNMQTFSQVIGAVVDVAAFSGNDKQKLIALVQSQHFLDDDDDESGAPALDASMSYRECILDGLADMKYKAEVKLSNLRKAVTNAKQNFNMLNAHKSHSGGIVDVLADMKDKVEVEVELTYLCKAETEAKQNVDLPVPRVVEEIVETIRVIPQQYVQQHTVERIVNVPIPHTVEEMVEAVQKDVEIPQCQYSGVAADVQVQQQRQNPQIQKVQKIVEVPQVITSVRFDVDGAREDEDDPEAAVNAIAHVYWQDVKHSFSDDEFAQRAKIQALEEKYKLLEDNTNRAVQVIQNVSNVAVENRNALVALEKEVGKQLVKIQQKLDHPAGKYDFIEFKSPLGEWLVEIFEKANG